MKYLLILLLIIFSLNNISAQGTWVKQSSPVNSTLFKSSFIDTSNIWVCGANGVILYTSNGGINWIKQNSNTDYQIVSISFVNNRLGWAIANKLVYANPVIYSTTNGGLNWNISFYADTNLIFSDIYFLDSLYGFIGGNSGLFLRTTNGGINWIKGRADTSLFSQLSVRNILPIDRKNIIACGGQMDIAGVMWKSVDSGYNYVSTIVAPEPIFSLTKLDSLNYLGTGGDYEFGASIVHSSNIGLNWNYSAVPFFGIGYGIGSRTNKEWWLGLGFSYTMANTSNSGNNWSSLQLPDSCGVYNIIFPDSLHGWAFGMFGCILKYNKTTSSINSNENNIPKSFILHQNYPNPFNSNSKIKIEIPSKSKAISGNVKLIIYDISGRKVETLINKNLIPGIYELIFSNNQLPSGVYFYQLLFDNKIIDTKKLVILK